MNPNSSVPDERSAIEALLKRWEQAACASDLDAVMACYTDDLVAYDAVLQLQFRGAAAYRAHWQRCMEMCPGGTLFEMAEPAIVADGGTLAFAHYLLRCGGPDEHGELKTSWLRGTVGLRRGADGWRIAHEHISVPFDMQSGKALFDLTP